MIVAIHQPNYFPWLGYFAKIAAADEFIFLDDVQFSKGSYTSRTQIGAAQPEWLSVAVSVRSRSPINSVKASRVDWATAHRDRLRQVYREAKNFRTVMRDVEAWLAAVSGEGLSVANETLIRNVCDALGLATRLRRSSDLQVKVDDPTERLIEIVRSIDPAGTYLSGAGGAKYNDAEAFSCAGIALTYSSFTPQPYSRGDLGFLPGLSVLDAAFHLGWDGTAGLVRGSA